MVLAEPQKDLSGVVDSENGLVHMNPFPSHALPSPGPQLWWELSLGSPPRQLEERDTHI